MAIPLVMYPSHFPKPLRAGFAYYEDAGLIRADNGNGQAVQRQAFKTLPHHFNLTFVVSLTNYKNWVHWVNNNAFFWFELKGFWYRDLECSPLKIRFTSDLTVTPFNSNYLSVTVEAEQYIGWSQRETGSY